MGVLALALLLRIGFIFYLQPERLYFSDSIDYLKAANNLVHEGEFGEGYKRPPLYPVFLGRSWRWEAASWSRSRSPRRSWAP